MYRTPVAEYLLTRFFRDLSRAAGYSAGSTSMAGWSLGRTLFSPGCWQLSRVRAGEPPPPEPPSAYLRPGNRGPAS